MNITSNLASKTVALNKLSSLSKALPARSELHVARKLWHMTTGLMIVFLTQSGLPKHLILSVLGGLFIWSVTMEVLRFNNPVLNERCLKILAPFVRSHEVNKVSGIPYYLGSSVLAVSIFPAPIAALSLMFLAVGDPVASFFGILCKKRSVKIVNGKSLHGTAAGFIACALVAWFYLKNNATLHLSSLELLRLSLLGGFAGSLAELLPLEIDDNFSIPIVSGFIFWLGYIAVHLV